MAHDLFCHYEFSNKDYCTQLSKHSLTQGLPRILTVLQMSLCDALFCILDVPYSIPGREHDYCECENIVIFVQVTTDAESVSYI